MHNLVIDIGNTNSKLGVFEEGKLVVSHTMKRISSDAVNTLIKQHSIVNSTISSVSTGQEELVNMLMENTNYIPFSTSVNTGIANYYGSPSTLGLDRWAKVIAAHKCYSGKTAFIIDAGTCITYDLLTSNGEYYGGSISLGLSMRFDALHHFTKRLPLVEWDRNETEIPKGQDTLSAIKNGVLQGAVNEVEGFIALNYKENKDLTVLVTGGDASFLLVQLKNSIFAPHIIHDPYLVLKGLNEVIAFEYVQKN
jgi:type III pantothenate kinase